MLLRAAAMGTRAFVRCCHGTGGRAAGSRGLDGAHQKSSWGGDVAGTRGRGLEGSRRCSRMAWAVAERSTTATTRRVPPQRGQVRTSVWKVRRRNRRPIATLNPAGVHGEKSGAFMAERSVSSLWRETPGVLPSHTYRHASTLCRRNPRERGPVRCASPLRAPSGRSTGTRPGGARPRPGVRHRRTHAPRTRRA
jgi:hypothetical protein